MIKVGVVGLGKMGLSHHALLHAHPEVEAIACDSSKFVLGVLEKNTGVTAYSDYERMLAEADLDAVVIATPSSAHTPMVRAALERGLHVFCEKPLTLSSTDSEALTQIAEERGLVTQVGYHNRFVAAFREVRALLDAGAIGEVTHVLGEAYGPVVLKQKGGTWRSKRAEGGGCLYDYAAHVINLMNWYLGKPTGVGGTVLPKVFSADTDDAAFGTLYFPGAKTGQVSVYWSDESYRKMTTRVTIWGTAGRIFADRQECQVYLRDTATIPPGYEEGWNVRYTTDLTEPVWFYLRGEEYSSQVEAFVEQVKAGAPNGESGFAAAAATDQTIAMMVADAEAGPSTGAAAAGEAPAPGATRRRRPWRRAG
jgi:scyllo-inositol 2-dehydrogenase (NADP+)